MADETPFIENNSPDQPTPQPQLHIDPTGQTSQAQPSYVQDFYQPQEAQAPQAEQPQQPFQPTAQPYQPAGDPNQQYQQPAQPQQPFQQPYQQPYVQQRVFHQPANSRLLAMLMYWAGIIGLIMAVTVADRNDPFIKHHMNQMVILFLAGIICAVVSVIPILGLVGFAGGIAVLVFTIMATIDAYHGDIKALPLIGNIQIIK